MTNAEVSIAQGGGFCCVALGCRPSFLHLPASNMPPAYCCLAALRSAQSNERSSTRLTLNIADQAFQLSVEELKAQAPAAPEEVLVAHGRGAAETLNGHRDFVLNTVQCN